MPGRLPKTIRIPLLVVAVYAAMLAFMPVAHKINSYFRAEARKDSDAFYSRLVNSPDVVISILGSIGLTHRNKIGREHKRVRIPADYVVLETHDIGGHHLGIIQSSEYFFVIFNFEEYKPVILLIGETKSQKDAAIESIRRFWLYELKRGKKKKPAWQTTPHL